MINSLRHVLVILLIAAACVLAVEPLLFSGSTPLISRLSIADRASMFDSTTTVAATLMGFLIAAVAILVTLDISRQIVAELRSNESFLLLIINLLAAIALLLAVTVVGLMGSVQEDWIADERGFQVIYEVLLLASFLEVLLAGFFFGAVTYKVGKYP